MKKLAFILALLFTASPLMAQSYRLSPFPRLQFFTNTGAVASGYKLCTFDSGTSTPLAAYSNSTGTTLPNPITLNSAGRPQTSGLTETGLYLGSSPYKINLYAAGTGNTCNGTPVGALIWSQDPVTTASQFSATVQTVAFSATPSFDVSVAQLFSITLTGNVTSSTLPSAVGGSVIEMTICQDGTGNRTFAWPVSVLTPPVISPAASSCTSSSFFYDGSNWRPFALNGTKTSTGYYFGGDAIISGAESVGSLTVAGTTSIGTNGGVGGKIAMNGATGGTLTAAVSDTTTTFTLTLPPTPGTSGQFLQTDGGSPVARTSFVSPGFAKPGGRLTTESGAPISTTNRTAQGTIYYTPYTNNQIYVYNGTSWQLISFIETGLSLTATSGKNYDVFAFATTSSLNLALSAAWTTDTARADALARQDGIWVKSSDHTRLWLGTIRASGTNVTADSIGGTTTQVGGQGFICNYYNPVKRPLMVIDTTSAWSYTSATIRQADAATGNKVEAVFCDAGQSASAIIVGGASISNQSAHGAFIGVGVDSTTVISGLSNQISVPNIGTLTLPLTGKYDGYPGLGYHYLAWLESGADTSSSFIGNNGAVGVQSGMTAFTER